MSRKAEVTVEIECKSCGAVLEVAKEERTATCPYCACPSVIERPPLPDKPRPTFTLTFLVPREKAETIMKQWISNLMFTLRRADIVKDKVPELKGVYLPIYLYSAATNTEYSVEIGEKYTTGTGKNRRTRTEWRFLDGRYATYLDDVLVSASRGIPNNELEAVEPFDLRALHRYSPALISGWLAEEPSRTQDECFNLAHDEAMGKIGRLLCGFMPGDSYRDLRYEASLEKEVIDLVLAPIWLLTVQYREDKPPVRILVNGQTGRIYGKTPLSWIKISVVVGIPLLLVLILFLIALIAGAING